MATVRFYRGHWVADYYDANKRRRIERPDGHFAKAKQELHAAQVLLADRVAEVADGLVHEGRGTFEDAATRWLNEQSQESNRAKQPRSESPMGSRRDDLPAHRAPRTGVRLGVPPKALVANPTKATPREEEHPPPAVRPRQEVQRVNQRCIEMLTQAARMARPEMSPLVTELREVLVQMTPETRARAARRTFLLVDMELGNIDLWQRFKSHAARVGTALVGRGTFSRSAAVQLARDTLMLAWYGVRADCHGARLLLGLSAAVSDIIAGLSLTDINRIAERQFRYVRPRWEDRPDLWRNLLSASQTPDIRRARDVNLIYAGYN